MYRPCVRCCGIKGHLDSIVCAQEGCQFPPRPCAVEYMVILRQIDNMISRLHSWIIQSIYQSAITQLECLGDGLL